MTSIPPARASVSLFVAPVLAPLPAGFRRGLLIVGVLLAACGAPAVAPTPSPTPAATPVPTLDAQVTDVQYGFLSNVNDLTSDVEGLATSSCADMATELQANPTEVADMRSLASTVQRVGSSQPALDSNDVRSALADLSKAVSQLDAAVSACGGPGR